MATYNALPLGQVERSNLSDDNISDVYSDDLERTLAALGAGGLTADAALRVVAMLIAEAPDASRQKIDQLKIMDKLINTSRGLMETRMKTGEAEALAQKLESLENELEGLASEKRTPKKSRRVADFFSFLMA